MSNIFGYDTLIPSSSTARLPLMWTYIVLELHNGIVHKILDRGPCNKVLRTEEQSPASNSRNWYEQEILDKRL